MPSLYLGSIGQGNERFEIHAITKNAGFREIPASSIADEGLFLQMLQGRYDLLKSRQAIYCTAVSPDNEKRIEFNPHDEREGTLHFISIDKDNNIEAALSVAVDIGEHEQGTHIGVPLENRWKRNGFPEGDSLDRFRKRYIRNIRGENRDVIPYEMAEFYRHYKRFGKNNHMARIGLYCGCYHLLYREAIKRERTPTTLLVFDAILQYYNQYRFAGAFLRNFAIDDNPRLVSPARKILNRSESAIFWNDHNVSRLVQVPFPTNTNGSVEFTKTEVPFLDGVVDFVLLSNAIVNDVAKLSGFNPEGLDNNDHDVFLRTVQIIMRRAFLENILIPPSPVGELTWEFSEVGN